MSRYLLIQTVSFVVTLWVVVTLVFLAVRALPGDAATIMGGVDASQEEVAGRGPRGLRPAHLGNGPSCLATC